MRLICPDRAQTSMNAIAPSPLGDSHHHLLHGFHLSSIVPLLRYLYPYTPWDLTSKGIIMFAILNINKMSMEQGTINSSYAGTWMCILNFAQPAEALVLEASHSTFPWFDSCSLHVVSISWNDSFPCHGGQTVHSSINLTWASHLGFPATNLESLTFNLTFADVIVSLRIKCVINFLSDSRDWQEWLAMAGHCCWPLVVTAVHLCHTTCRLLSTQLDISIPYDRLWQSAHNWAFLRHLFQISHDNDRVFLVSLSSCNRMMPL